MIEKPIEKLSKDDFCGVYDVFFHLAWSGVPSGHKNETGNQVQNILFSLKALEICNEIGCNLFVATGTVAEYALGDGVMDFQARQSPNDIYGAAKVAACSFLEVRARQLGQPFIWVVLPSTFGERRTDDNIVTYTIRTLLKGQKPLYGSLEQMWDFLYAADVVRALRMISETGKAGKIYGIGSGRYDTLKNYVECIRDMIDPKLPLGIGERPTMTGKAFSSCVNIYDLVRDTGFQPRVSFEDGIKRTIEWMKGAGE